MKEYRLLLWSFITDEIEYRLNIEAAAGWTYRDQLPTGLLLERAAPKPQKAPGGHGCEWCEGDTDLCDGTECQK